MCQSFSSKDPDNPKDQAGGIQRWQNSTAVAGRLSKTAALLERPWELLLWVQGECEPARTHDGAQLFSATPDRTRGLKEALSLWSFSTAIRSSVFSSKLVVREWNGLPESFTFNLPICGKTKYLGLHNKPWLLFF